LEKSGCYTKVPEVVEGAILPYLYDFYLEREIEWNVAAKCGTSVKISGYKGSDNQPSPKKPRV
jgi:hypothetical protein